jgi:hypothetical protein
VPGRAIRIGVNRNGGDSQTPRGSSNAAGNFASIGDEQAS